MDDRLTARNLQQLRQARARPERDLSIAGEMAALEKTLARQARSSGNCGDAWLALCPPHLLPGTAVVGTRRGIFTVRCASASVRFELDRWLRSGGEDALIRACPTTLTRVKLT